MQLLLGQLSPTFMQNWFRSPPCPILTFSLQNKNILKAIKTACIKIIRCFAFELTASIVTASFHLKQWGSFNLQNSNTSLIGLHTHHSTF